MRIVILYILIVLGFPINLFSQNDVTRSSTFRNIYYSSLENDLITLSHNYKKRADKNIKTITKKKLSSKNWLDSLIEIDPIKNFVENHVGTIEYSMYNKQGFLMSTSLIPLNVRLNKKDSAEHRYVMVKTDSIKHEYIIDYYYNNTLYQKEIYANNVIKERIEIKKEFNLGEAGNPKRDTTYFCDQYIKYKYDKNGLLMFREYNNTEFTDRKKLCDIVEYENYKYEKNKITVTKFPYKEVPLDNQKYINEITKNKNGQVVKSIFYMNNLNTPFIMYTLEYDQKSNLKCIYESNGLKDPFENKLFEYENIYNDKGLLKEVVETCPGFNMTYDKKVYFFNEKGLLEKIKYIGSDWERTELYKYTFY